MDTLKKPAVLFALGIIVGYVFSRTLDNVPVINRLPKITLRF